MQGVLLMLALCGQLDAAKPADLPALNAAQPLPKPPAYAIRRSLKPGTRATTPYQAVELAVKDARTLEHRAACARYVWIPDWIESDSGFAQVSLVANSTISRTPNIIQPVSLADGKLVRLDVAKFAAKDEQINGLLDAYEKLRDLDSWFTERHDSTYPPIGSAIGIKLTTGKWDDATYQGFADGKFTCLWQGKSYDLPGTDVRFEGRLFCDCHGGNVAADYLGSLGRELRELTHSDVPIMRLDEWVAGTFSTVNGGQYYQLAGIGANLEDVVREFAGNDAAEKVKRAAATMRQAQQQADQTGQSVAKVAQRLDPEFAKSKCYIATSGVTGRQRLVLLFNGTQVPLTTGVQLVAVTFDIAEDNTDPDSDVRRNPLNFDRYNGGEMILMQQNGLLVYHVFNAEDKTLASVPDNVAVDREALKVRSNVSTARVFSGLSCANCHEASEKAYGWQPLANDRPADQPSLFKLIDDRSQRSADEARQLYNAQYSGDMESVLDLSRLSYQRQAHLATKQPTTREAVKGLADSYWGHWYDHVTPSIAVRDFGRVLSDDEARDWLIEHFEGLEFDDETLRQDATLADLMDGHHVAPAQWRTVYPHAAEQINLETEGMKP